MRDFYEVGSGSSPPGSATIHTKISCKQEFTPYSKYDHRLFAAGVGVGEGVDCIQQ